MSENFPPGSSINENTGFFTWTPTETQGPGVYPVTVRVTDPGGLGDTKTFEITVNEVVASRPRSGRTRSCRRLERGWSRSCWSWRRDPGSGIQTVIAAPA